MAPSPLQQRRTHNTLLFQKLLNLREGASPFTLVLDTLEQSAAPVIQEFVRRAKISKSKIIFISYAALKKQVLFPIDTFITTRTKSLSTLRTEILAHLPPPPTGPPLTTQNATKYLLIIDTLNPLSSTHGQNLSPFLSSLLLSPQISLLAIYHTDIPAPKPTNPYQPSPLTTLTYLATAILSVSSLSQTLARKRARDKSLQEPVFGLAEGREGVIVGLKRDGKAEGVGRGVVIAMEIRRRSGRGVLENFVLVPPSLTLTPSTTNSKIPQLSNILLLDEHPLYASTPLGLVGMEENVEAEAETTFSLGLTEKQKRDRENVVLPYFDAQKEGGALGAGEGGRILYDMGAEDREDFDDEEDEI